MSSKNEILVNGQVHSLLAPRTLAELIGELGHAPDSVATALNGEFIARGQRVEHVLCDGDRVTCFQAITGG